MNSSVCHDNEHLSWSLYQRDFYDFIDDVYPEFHDYFEFFSWNIWYQRFFIGKVSVSELINFLESFLESPKYCWVLHERPIEINRWQINPWDCVRKYRNLWCLHFEENWLLYALFIACMKVYWEIPSSLKGLLIYARYFDAEIRDKKITLWEKDQVGIEAIDFQQRF